MKGAMDEKALKGNGRMYFGAERLNSKGMCVGRDFFNRLSEKCYRNLAKYWRQMNRSEHLFTYSERQSPSYLMPALFTVADGTVMCEMPLTRRKYGKDNKTGFLDYWAHYGKFPIAIEVKHSRYNLRSEKMGSTANKWKKANKQLRQATYDHITTEKSYLRLNLMLLYFQASGEWKQPDGSTGTGFEPEHQDEACNYHNKVMKHLKPAPNVWSYWKLPDEMVKMEIDDKGKTHFYPAVAIYGHLELVEKKKRKKS